MPFQSERQRRFMWARHPEIARRWAKKYGSTPLHDAVTRRRKRKRAKAA